jgi:hypothetical protein
MLEIGRAYGATEWQIFWKKTHGRASHRLARPKRLELPPGCDRSTPVASENSVHLTRGHRRIRT